MIGFKSLRAGIFINFAFMLFLAIALTDLVLLQITEQRLVDNRIRSAVRIIPDVFGDVLRDSRISENSDRIAGSGLISGALITTDGLSGAHKGRLPESVSNRVYRLHEKAVRQGRAQTAFAGSVWGVFWPRDRYALVSQSLPGPEGTVTAVVPLSPVYDTIRDVQQMALFYLFINLLFILSLGGWRISRMVTRPINRLIRITDQYRSTEGIDLFPERQNDEFSRLSGALNQMLRRIEADRDELHSSLVSLEQTHRQLKAAQKEIVRAEKLASTGRLSAGLAHEIGNPIGIVLGYLGLLKNRVPADDRLAADYIERAEQEIQRVNNTIRQLLDFSRSRQPEFSVISVHELVKYAGGMLSQQPLFSGIKISYQLEAEVDRVYGDSDQLHQVLVNLMINAADSIKQSGNSQNGFIQLATSNSEPGGRRATDAGKMIKLKVIDNGTGIDEQNLDKIFDPFFTTKETGKGTGLGLSVSYMIVEQMGGGITVDLPETGGTGFVIRLPVAENEGENSSPAGHLNNNSSGKI